MSDFFQGVIAMLNWLIVAVCIGAAIGTSLSAPQASALFMIAAAIASLRKD